MNVSKLTPGRSAPANWLVGLGALLAAVALAWLLSRVLRAFSDTRFVPLALIDYLHYDQAARLIWQGKNPYGVVEYFAPPWLAVFLLPLLPLDIALASAL